MKRFYPKRSFTMALFSAGSVPIPTGRSWARSEHQESRQTFLGTGSSSPASWESFDAGNFVFACLNPLSISNWTQDSSVIPMLTLAKHCCILVNNCHVPSQRQWHFGVMVSVLMCVVYKSLLQLLEQKIICECKDKIILETQWYPAHPPNEHIWCFNTTSHFPLSVPLHLHEITKAERREFVLNFK